MMHPARIIAIDNTLLQKIAAHLVTNYHGDQVPTVQHMLAYIPSEVKNWQKIKISARDEVIRAASLINDDERSSHDNTYVKVNLAK
jgi:hypothetical protein